MKTTEQTPTANTCFQSTVPAPIVLPAIGRAGFYIMPAIIIDGKEIAPEVKYRVVVVDHIGAFGLRLRERSTVPGRIMEIETHFTSFEPTRFDYLQRTHDGKSWFIVRQNGCSCRYVNFNDAVQAVFNS